MLIREAIDKDADFLPAIDSSSAQLFKTIPTYAWIAEAQPMPLEKHQSFIAEDKVWVSEHAGELVGFIIAKAHGSYLHIYELSVDYAHQRQGIGSALIERVYQYALGRHYRYLSLTTFREIPWNAPFYSQLGFQFILQDQLPTWLVAILAREQSVFKENQRCAMVRKVLAKDFT